LKSLVIIIVHSNVLYLSLNLLRVVPNWFTHTSRWSARFEILYPVHIISN
jgi:hypothetical protein